MEAVEPESEAVQPDFFPGAGVEPELTGVGRWGSARGAGFKIVLIIGVIGTGGPGYPGEYYVLRITCDVITPAAPAPPVTF